MRIETPLKDPAPKHEPHCDVLSKSVVPRNEAVYPDLTAWAHIVFKAKVRARIYFDKPEKDDDQTLKRIRSSLEETGGPSRRIRFLKKKYKNKKSFIRRLFLANGYLYEERHDVASAIVKELSLTDLFEAPILYRVHRGEIQRLVRRDDEYHTPDGQRATLLLNDRVAERPGDLEKPCHLDLDEVAFATGAGKIAPMVIGEGKAGVELVFPDGEKRLALIALHGTRTAVECIGGNPETLDATLKKAKAFRKTQDRIIHAAKQLATERPIFDEPLDEIEGVQEDGDLRLEWWRAYKRRERTFMFREVSYKVFDYRGNPIPPEVCVDFVFDAWERAHGTWYRKRGGSPGKTQGAVDFSALDGLSRRHIPSILEFSAERETLFMRYDIPRRRWIPYEKHRRFIKNLLSHAHEIREGDMLVIHGIREEDMANHYHAALVLKTDILTGIPTLVADNQGRPRIWTLSRAMRTAPKRSIKHRIRIDFDEMAELTKTARAAKNAK